MVAIDDISGAGPLGPVQKTAEEQGFQSVVGIPLLISDHKVGSLNVYDNRLRSWSEEGLAAAGVLSDMATAYLVRSSELAEARELNRQLQTALESRVVIDQAKRMLARAVVEDGLELPHG